MTDERRNTSNNIIYYYDWPMTMTIAKNALEIKQVSSLIMSVKTFRIFC